MVTTSSTECGLDVKGELEMKSLPEVAAQPDHEDTSTSEHRISIQETPSYCCRVCKEEDTLGNLIELSCNCQGDLSRAHKLCILKWFGVRMWLRGNYTCDICTATLDSVWDMVISAITDDEDCKILLEAIGATSALPANTTLEVVGQNMEENPSQRAQPRQDSACWRFFDSNTFCDGLVFVCLILMVISLYWAIYFISHRTSNQN